MKIQLPGKNILLVMHDWTGCFSISASNNSLLPVGLKWNAWNRFSNDTYLLRQALFPSCMPLIHVSGLNTVPKVFMMFYHLSKEPF